MQQENTPTHQPEATPGAVAAALPGYSPTAVKAGHGFCCWLCHRDCPDWQRRSLLVAGQPQQQRVRQGAGQPPAGFGSQAQPCCTGQRAEVMGHCVRICVLQPQAVTVLLEAKAVSCLSCHSWDTAPAAPSCGETAPAPAAGLLPHLPAQPGQGLCTSGIEGPGLLERLQALPPSPPRKVQAGLLTLLHSIQAKPESLSLRGNGPRREQSPSPQPQRPQQHPPDSCCHHAPHPCLLGMCNKE